jgi:hypothetical protein
MKNERQADRVWDTDVNPGGWCHRECWLYEHPELPGLNPQQRLLREIFGEIAAGGKCRKTIAARKVRETGRLIIRRTDSH